MLTNLLPSLETTQQEIVLSIEQYETKFVELKDRLNEVRAEKREKESRRLEKEQEGTNISSVNSTDQTLFKTHLHNVDDFEDELRKANDNLSVSEISASSLNTRSGSNMTSDDGTASTKSFASTVNSNFSNK